MGEIHDERSKLNDKKIQELKRQLTEAETSVKANDACVYLTGSYARGEATEHSDLDLFIVGRTQDKKRKLTRLDELCIKADLVRACEKVNLPKFSGDGEYLRFYTVDDLVSSLGSPDDDSKNTLTARLLLLLESRPLLGEEIYEPAIKQVITAYWRDSGKFPEEFRPAYLANDILRLWRTFCVNYEARTNDESQEDRAKRKLKNFKLKHSRLLTCYSALLALVDVYGREGNVTEDDALAIVKQTPMGRLTNLHVPEAGKKLRDAAIEIYEDFLRRTAKSENELIQRIVSNDNDNDNEPLRGEGDFSEAIFKLMVLLGKRSKDPGEDFNKLFRIIVV